MPLSWRRRRDRPAPSAPGHGPPLRGPEKAYFRRLAGGYSPVSSNGPLMLTATHLVFGSRIGRDVLAPLAEVQRAEERPIRRFRLGGHDRQLVVTTRSGTIGFLLADPGGWAAAIAGRLPAAGRGAPAAG
jgi:hypothetical protein